MNQTGPTDVEAIIQRALACATSGDTDGEIEAYRLADDLGDADAAVFLGNALRQRGELDAARQAYSRAESRGHREAAMSIGNMLSDMGDREGARESYRRAINMGSTLAALNLGLNLADEGEFEAALGYLRIAADSGDATGQWAIGRIHEQRGDLASAVIEYRRGAELGDAASAYGLGATLYDQGDAKGAEAAFHRAADLGHEGASSILKVLHRNGGPGARSTNSVQDLWANITAPWGAVARYRRELGNQWIAGALEEQERRAQRDALAKAHAETKEQLRSMCHRFNTQPAGEPQDLKTLIPGPNSRRWLHGSGGSWSLAQLQTEAFESDFAEASISLLQAQTGMILFKGSYRHAGAESLGRVERRLKGLRAAATAAAKSVEDAEQNRDAMVRATAARASDALEPIIALAASSTELLPLVLQPWSSQAWESWSLDDSSNRGLRFSYGGLLTPLTDDRLGPQAKFATDLRMPYAFELHHSWYLQHDGPHRAAAHGFIRSQMLRHLLTVAPGEVKFCVFDPVGLGQSAGVLLDLAEYDADLIGGKVWSSHTDLEGRLAELSDHIELVIQKHLRTTYGTIDDFNDAAGEVAEPYRILVLFDFPIGLTTQSAARLKSIVENGPRCGVFSLICVDSSASIPYGVDVNQISTGMRKLNLQGTFIDTLDGYQLQASFEHDVLPDGGTIAKRVIDSIGRACIERGESTVTFEKMLNLYGQFAARGLRPELGAAPAQTIVGDPSTWWGGDSTSGLFAPIGQKGARDLAILPFDSSDHPGALLVGRPGSGKSTLLHAYIGGLTTYYGPEELELYLIDFKEGVEFKSYAQEQLPHAKVIAIESDREFGLSVLESLRAEITHRAEVLRATGGRQSGMQGLRQATGEKIPRVLMVFDEFQVLFARNDKVGLAAADLLESIIRQGRGFGVHVLLGSQSLAGLDALGAHVPQLLPVRILLPAAESDARKLLGDNNTAGDYLTGRGEGILNPSGGAVEANERFKGALLAETNRVERLRMLRAKANERGFTRAPRVFEGDALSPLDAQDPLVFREELASSGGNPMRLRSGTPMTVGEIGDIVLHRESSANVLTIARCGDSGELVAQSPTGAAYGLLVAAVASACISDAAIDIVDFMSNDDGLDELLEPLLNARRVTLRRRRAFPDVLQSYIDEVDERVEQDDPRRAPKLLLLFGIHRARELVSDLSSLDADDDLSEKLERVLRDGPEVGVHVWLWSDTVTGASRRLTPRMMRELSWRIAGKMNGDDSQSFIGITNASDLRESQLLIVNEDRGLTTRVTAYESPSSQWLTRLVAVALGE